MVLGARRTQMLDLIVYVPHNSSECLNKLIYILFGKHNRWLEFQNIVLNSIPTDQHTSLTSLEDDLLCTLSIVYAGFLVLDDLDALEKAHSADVTHEGELL